MLTKVLEHYLNNRIGLTFEWKFYGFFFPAHDQEYMAGVSQQQRILGLMNLNTLHFHHISSCKISYILIFLDFRPSQ